MIVDIDNPSAADAVNLGDWSAAEFLDTSCAGSLTLRALVCRLGAGQWQWSIISYDGEHAELISIGTETSMAAARAVAAAELTKCLENPIDAI